MLKRLWLIFAQACTVALALGFVLATLKPQWLQHDGSLSDAARRAAPAVVALDVESRGSSPHPGLGSGVIVDPSGLVLTNQHVIAGARRIDVRLADGRQAEAVLIGSDPETDLALLRIPLRELPVAQWGRSGSLRVGDPVLAIGNPFGVGQSVSAGIVSALQRRQLGINVFENFIQTDAAINPGNSGGALVDGAGRLVGIPSAIYSRSGGNLGLGFAIPAELAQSVLQALQRDGHVTRGWIGVQSRELTPELAKALKLRASAGVLVSAVVQEAPAALAGVRAGDVLHTVAGQAIRSPDQLLEKVSALKPGSQTQVQVEREGRKLELKVRIAQRPVPAQEEAVESSDD